MPVLAGLQEFSGYGTWSWTFEFRVESPVHSWQFNQVNGGDWVGIEFNDRGRFSLSDGALFTTVTLPDTLGAPATVRAGGIELDQVSPGQSLTFADFCSQLGHELLSDEGSFGIAEFELILGTAPTSEQCGARLTLAVRLDYSRAQTSPAVALEFGNPWFFPDGFEGP